MPSLLAENKVWDSPHSQSHLPTSDPDFLRQKWDEPPVFLLINTIHVHLPADENLWDQMFLCRQTLGTAVCCLFINTL